MIEAVAVFLAQYALIMLLGLQQLFVTGRQHAWAFANSVVLGNLSFFLTSAIALKAGDFGSPTWWGYILGGPLGIVSSMLV